MRILFVISGLEVGGAETQTIRLTHKLALRGHQVGLHILTSQVSRLPEVDQGRIEVTIDPKSSRLDFGVIRRLRSRVVTQGYEAIIALLYDANIYARLAAIGLPVQVINTERSSNYHLSFQQLWAHRLTRWRVDKLISNSRQGQRHAIRYLGYAGRRCETIWNGIDAATTGTLTRPTDANVLTHPLPFSPGAKTLYVIGKLSPVKDQALAIRVLVELRNRQADWHLALVGGDPDPSSVYSKSLSALVESLNLRGHVHFLGARSDVANLLTQANVLLSSSVFEGFPNVVLEAMQQDVPVVSTDHSDIREILPFEWQVEGDRDAARIARKIDQAVSLRPQVVAAQHTLLQQRFSTQCMVQAYEKALCTPGSLPVLARAPNA